MSEILVEFVDSGRQRLRVDRELGVIHGVKLLGLVSRNGRSYREAALVEAVGLYEGAKVNVNHPKGHPLSPRDYQDRLGVIRGVKFRAGEGLFGDLHFNPKHALSEQLVWDAEHAPQNVGLSHNVLARTTRTGDETAVEAISKVQSIDLVADPATTAGLFEHEERPREARGGASAAPMGGWDRLTLEELRQHRPDLVGELLQERDDELEELNRRLDEAATREAAAERSRRITELLVEHGLPLPGDDSEQSLLSEQFLRTLTTARDDRSLQRLIEERAALVQAAGQWISEAARKGHRPRSRDQSAIALGSRVGRQSAAEFAASLRGR
jgi:hypothetical protein